jgi:hypothetical protein
MTGQRDMMLGPSSDKAWLRCGRSASVKEIKPLEVLGGARARLSRGSQGLRNEGRLVGIGQAVAWAWRRGRDTNDRAPRRSGSC